jgi:hypothetical protein
VITLRLSHGHGEKYFAADDTSRAIRRITQRAAKIQTKSRSIENLMPRSLHET